MSTPFPVANPALTVLSTALTTSYVASGDIPVARARRRIRFTAVNVRSAGSGATSTKFKLQQRFNDGTTQTAYVDLPSSLDDVQAGPPIYQTLEVEHTFTTSANATTTNTFYLDVPEGVCEITVNVKTNATGQAGDATRVYVAAGV